MQKRIKKRHLICAGTVFIIITVAFAVIWGAWRGSGSKPIPLKNPGEIYAQAVSMLETNRNIYYRVDGTKETTIGNTVLAESFTQLITYEAWGTETPRGCVEQTLHIGSYDIESFDILADGTRYLTIQGSGFTAPGEADGFAAKYPPAVPIESALYADVTGVSIAGNATISFTNPAVVEDWAADGSAELTSAEGTAFIDRDGNLTKSIYTATYKQGGSAFKLHITVEVLDFDVRPIQTPDTSAYTSISDINTPLLLEKACGYLTSVGAIRAEYSDAISCQAFGDERSQTTRLVTGGTDDWSAQVDTTVSVSNSSKAGVVTTHTKTEQFTGNQYTASEDGCEYASNPDVDLSAMKSYCQNLLIGTMLLPRDIAAVDLKEIDNLYCITFRASDEFAQLLAEEACTTLYQNPDVLKDLAHSSSIDAVICYLNVEKYTGFPVSSGFDYRETYTISELPYALSYKADQTYTLPD